MDAQPGGHFHLSAVCKGRQADEQNLGLLPIQHLSEVRIGFGAAALRQLRCSLFLCVTDRPDRYGRYVAQALRMPLSHPAGAENRRSQYHKNSSQIAFLICQLR